MLRTLRAIGSILVTLLVAVFGLFAQAAQTTPVLNHTKYLDPVGGLTVDRAVDIALERNTELTAMRKEAEAGEALLRQAGFRPNPSLELRGTRQLGGGDNSLMIEGGLPLELGGRRKARIRVAAQELEIRRQAAAARELQLAAEVRNKFGEALAAILKLKFTEELLALAANNLDLVSAQVAEGRRAPLDEGMETVELNRIRTMRETADSAAEISLLELRNLLGMTPEEPLALRGDLEGLIEPIPSNVGAAERALQTRPDLA
ncbi:MAG: TolC family protein, partial [Pyrinomonadaceae bacterium]|nr:TolC family protein [Pyrinomonadaceae bacterium]